ncbi:MAG: hypothetical protein ACTHLD_06155 [Chitinophaga sp.]
MLIDIIFKGSYATLDWEFLRTLLPGARNVYFPDPETAEMEDFNEIMEVIRSNPNAYLIMGMDKLDVDEKIVPHIFVGCRREGDEVEFLLFFDSKDIGGDTEKQNFDYLRKWMEGIQKKYYFKYFICKINSGKKELGEYYFDSCGTGPFYNEI